MRTTEKRQSPAFVAALLTLSILLLAPLAWPGERRPEPFGPKQTSVEINDFEKEIDLLIQNAEEAEFEGDYELATELYQEAARTAPRNYVIRVAARTYLGAKELVKSRVAAWPKQGIETYRRLISPRVREMVTDALERNDVRSLRRVAREFPHAAEAPGIMLDLGTRALTRGDLDLALRHFLEILRLYPAGPIPGVARQDVLARAGVAAAKLGDRLILDEVRALAAELPPETVVEVAGNGTPLIGLLDGLTIVSPGELAPEGWAGVGGGPARRGGREGPVGPFKRYLTLRTNPTLSDDYGSYRERDDRSRHTPIHPLIGDGFLLLPDHATIQAIPLPGGDPEAEPWSFPPPEDEDDTGLSPDFRNIPVFGALAGGVLTIPYRDPSMSIGYTLDVSKQALLTIDIRTGIQLDGRGAGNPEELTLSDLPEEIEFCGSPAIANDRVYITGFRSRHLVETFVLCFNSGGRRGGLRLRWVTSVCMGEGRRSDSYNEYDAHASSVTIRNGLAYLCSNTGAVAALEADTGEIVWLHTYEQAKRRTNLLTREVRTTTTWHANPPMLDHRLLYVTPQDADRLFIYHQRPDLKTGYVVHDHFGRDQIVNGFDPEYMLGVRDGVIFLAGTTRSRGERPLFAVKSGPRSARAEGQPGDQQRILWRAEIEEDAPAGRGILAGDWIYFPTEKGIYRVAIGDGKVTRLIGLSDFPDPDDPDGVIDPIGNLAVSGPWLVTAGEHAITLFGPVPEQKDEPESGD